VPELRFGRRGFALGIEELPDDDPLIEAMKRLDRRRREER
jgi:hypothetical protein